MQTLIRHARDHLGVTLPPHAFQPAVPVLVPGPACPPQQRQVATRTIPLSPPPAPATAR